jgi:hypothetical protein
MMKQEQKRVRELTRMQARVQARLWELARERDKKA